MIVSRRSALTMSFGALATLPMAGKAMIAAPRSSRSLALAEVVRRHTQARGGARVLDRVHSLIVMPTIVEKGSTLQARYLCSDAPAWRIDIYAGSKHVFSEGLDAEGPWLWPTGEPAAHDAVPDAKRTGLQGVEFNLYGLHRFPSRGHQLHLEGREVVDGKDYYVVRVTMRDSYETYLYISPITWMIDRRRDYRAFHPDVDQTKVFAEKQYFDFRTVSAIKRPFGERQVNWRTGVLVNSTTVNAMKTNPSIAQGELTRNYLAPAALGQLR